MQFKSLLCTYFVSMLAVTAHLQPANAGSYDLAANTTYGPGVELKQAAIDGQSERSGHRELRSGKSVAAVSMDNLYDQTYKDFSKAFIKKDHEKKASSTKTLAATINGMSVSVNSAIETLMAFFSN
jgi:hypothetical protein